MCCCSGASELCRGCSGIDDLCFVNQRLRDLLLHVKHQNKGCCSVVSELHRGCSGIDEVHFVNQRFRGLLLHVKHQNRTGAQKSTSIQSPFNRKVGVSTRNVEENFSYNISGMTRHQTILTMFYLKISSPRISHTCSHQNHQIPTHTQHRQPRSPSHHAPPEPQQPSPQPHSPCNEYNTRGCPCRQVVCGQ
jgi:hypothetical protein